MYFSSVSLLIPEIFPGALITAALGNKNLWCRGTSAKNKIKKRKMTYTYF
jgi:hypothetical protein